MKLNIKVIPNAKENKILESAEGIRVYVKGVPDKGKANKELIDILSDYYGVKKKDIKIIRGEKSRKKVVEIN